MIVVGAGAAGLMASIEAARAGSRVLLLEGQKTLGAKILISGGGRCNVTNARVSEADYNSGVPRTVRNILRSYPQSKTVTFFSTIGVELVEEQWGKLFPTSSKARTVLDALVKAAHDSGVRLEHPRRVTKVGKEGEVYGVAGEDFSFHGRTLILTTGGLSLPATGSDGGGFGLARSLGHTLTHTVPALAPLTSPDKGWSVLSGLSCEVRLSLFVAPAQVRGVTPLGDPRRADQREHGGGERRQDPETSASGPFLFTHRGFSGPAALDLSRHWAWNRGFGGEVRILASFAPGLTEEAFLKATQSDIGSHPNRRLVAHLGRWVPERLARELVRRSGLPEHLPLSQLSHEARKKLAQVLLQCELQVDGTEGFKKAEATAGGVPLDEVDAKTLESQKSPGLFLAGEILDVDGRLGGFNFQWAWSSGHVAGLAAAHKIKPS